MYGKFFSSTFTGSMFGAGADVFAVWGYIIANTVESTVELNPQMLAAVLGSTPERVEMAIDFLCAPDPRSRNAEHEGRRLMKDGPFHYFVVSHQHYKAIRNEEERREYNRRKQAESRARKKETSNDVSMTSLDSQSQSTKSANTEAGAEADKELLLRKTVIRLPAIGNQFYSITEDQVAHWKELFPAIDVMQCLRKMVAWLESNPSNKKTVKGMPRFISGWLSREQDRAPRLAAVEPPKPKKQYVALAPTPDNWLRAQIPDAENDL